jgi:hypothetical protein
MEVKDGSEGECSEEERRAGEGYEAVEVVRALPVLIWARVDWHWQYGGRIRHDLPLHQDQAGPA